MKKHNILNKINDEKWDFVKAYKQASNGATASQFDSNANVTSKNIAIEQVEFGKRDLISFNYYTMYKYLEKMYGEELANQFLKDEDSHIIYPHDSSSLMPYCCSISLYSSSSNVFV